MINIGIVGYGYWGPNLVRNFAELPRTRVVAVCDRRPERLALVQERYPSIGVTGEFDELLADPQIDAIAIATPVATHYPLARRALEAGKHVLVEKPLTTSVEQAQRLVDLAARRNLVLMVDHTFIYSGAVRKIKQLMDEEHLGRLYYYDSVRVNLGLFQHDINVLWDLAVHDLAIMDYVLGTSPRAVAATGIAHVPGRYEDIAYLTCYFDDGLIAHLHVNWLAPVKIRRSLIGGERRMVVYDDLEASEKIRVYDRGITLKGGDDDYQHPIGYRSGDVWSPNLPMTEALHVEANHFIDCIEQGRPPLSDGQAGLRIVRLLEAASQSMTQGGQMVTLHPEHGHRTTATLASLAPTPALAGAPPPGH